MDMKAKRCTVQATAKQRIGSPSKQRSKKKNSSCPFLQRDEHSQRKFVETVLALPMDIEDLSKLGRQRGTCPYYGVRRAVPEADVLLVPYSTLLQPDTRYTSWPATSDCALPSVVLSSSAAPNDASHSVQMYAMGF
eukprot:evm.model.scf_201EXC.2 EVM.evm.TU.scf_201EXC.2   scf_201EXC:16364-17914(-)